MVRLIFFLVLLILFTITMWENVKNTVSISFMGSPIFENAPVLLVILSSMLLGMLFVLPFVWLARLKLKKIETKEKQAGSKASPKGAKAAAKSIPTAPSDTPGM